MIEITRRDYELLLKEILNRKDLREIIGLIPQKYIYGLILLDISKGSKALNFRIIKEFALKNKIGEQFIIDQAKSVISIIKPTLEDGDYYKVLEGSPEFTNEELRQNWLKLIKMYHPDKIGEPGLEKTKKINEAYNILIDPVSREHYDKSYFPDIPVKIKNLNYTQFKNRRFLAVMSSLLLLIPVFYIYKSLTSSEVSIEYSEKPASKYLFKTNNDKSSIEIANNEEIVDTQSSDIDTGTDNAIVKQQDLDSLTDELYKDKEENTVSVSNLDEIEGEVIVRKQNLGDEIEEAAEYSLDMAGDAEIASVKIDDNKIDESVFTKLENEKETEKEIETDVSYMSTDPVIPKKYTVKKGDSLWSLSDKFDISINEIKKQNSLNKNTIKPGESLILSKTDDYTGGKKKSDMQVISGIDKNLKDSTHNIAVASKKRMIDEAKTINNKPEINKKKPIKVRNVEELELSLLKVNRINTPNKSSIYTAISDYIFAYKNKDMKKLGTLFDVNAKENGVSMDKVFKMYRKNFKVLDIVAYDIKFNKINLDKRKATVDGDFIISFTNTSEDVFKKSYGDINWKLTWNDKNWLINEIRYKVTSTKVGDDFNKQY